MESKSVAWQLRLGFSKEAKMYCKTKRLWESEALDLMESPNFYGQENPTTRVLLQKYVQPTGHMVTTFNSFILNRADLFVQCSVMHIWSLEILMEIWQYFSVNLFLLLLLYVYLYPALFPNGT